MGAAPLSPMALQVLEARYLRRDERGRVVETPPELFRRVAGAVASAETGWHASGAARHWADVFEGMMSSLEFLPNSPTLMNAGLPNGQLAACFVLPVGDSMEEIFEAVKRMAIIQKTGGGTGFSFSRLRPARGYVAGTGGHASGPVSFMRIFDAATENIKQGGRRRGANMGILRVDHPDILEFVACKAEGGFRNFNISVGATDAFMEAAQNGAGYDLVHPGTGAATGRADAGKVWDAIAENAWRTGDPGLVFLDRINEANPTPDLGPMEATNPCGEVPLLPHEACNLGSVNVSRFVTGDGKPALDRERLAATVANAVRFLDDVIQVNAYPYTEISETVLGNRKIGLGVMGFAEMLIRLGIPYDSLEAARVADDLMSLVHRTALEASHHLAEERGAFPNWERSVHGRNGLRLRNATVTSIAPTGTIGIIAGTSPSIEPLFALAYRRSHVLEEQTLVEVNPVLIEHLATSGLDAEAVLAHVRKKGTLREAKGVPPELQRLFVTALDVDPEQHLSIQAAFQRHVDNSVSKTINLPHEATPDVIAGIYRRAWGLGLKGVTVFRYGSKSEQVMELGVGEEPHEREHGSKCDPGECRL